MTTPVFIELFLTLRNKEKNSNSKKRKKTWYFTKKSMKLLMKIKKLKTKN